MAFIIDNTKLEFSSYQQLLEHRATHPFVEDVISFLRVWNDESQSHIPVHTSGSTGTPKLIELSKEAMCRSAEKTFAHFQLDLKATALLSLPVKFIAGKMMIVRAIVGDLDLILKEPCAFPMEGIDQQVDFLPLTPFQFSESCRLDISSFDKVKTVLLGGGPVGNLELSLARGLETRVVHGFGMTETITHIATRELAESAYTALPGISFTVDLENRLLIRADHIKGVVATTDVVELLDEQTFRWIGRADNVINTGGVKILPEQVEPKLVDLISESYFIASEEDERLGQKVVLYIESSSLGRFTSLKNDLTQVLTKYEVPKEVYLLPRFMKTETGKINRLVSIKEFGGNKITL